MLSLVLKWKNVNSMEEREKYKIGSKENITMKESKKLFA